MKGEFLFCGIDGTEWRWEWSLSGVKKKGILDPVRGRKGVGLPSSQSTPNGLGDGRLRTPTTQGRRSEDDALWSLEDHWCGSETDPHGYRTLTLVSVVFPSLTHLLSFRLKSDFRPTVCRKLNPPPEKYCCGLIGSFSLRKNPHLVGSLCPFLSGLKMYVSVLYFEILILSPSVRPLSLSGKTLVKLGLSVPEF